MTSKAAVSEACSIRLRVFPVDEKKSAKEPGTGTHQSGPSAQNLPEVQFSREEAAEQL